jgi:hypothetical protein
MTEDSESTAMKEEVKAEVTAEEVKDNVSAADSDSALARDVEATVNAETVEDVGEVESVPTLRQIFSLPEKDDEQGDDRWKTFQENVSKEVKGVKWISSMPDLAPKVCELLDIKIPNVLVTAWKKVEDIQKVIEESKKTPDKTVYIELAEHTIDYQSKPSIDVKIKKATVKKLELPIQLGFKLRGFVLKIQNGRIREMQTGNCEAKGTIKYGSLTIAEKKLEPIKLPFSIQIPDEIPFLTSAEEDETPVKAEADQVATPPAEQLERIEL